MKLQPNFSWQKYEGQPEEQKEQFQKQLQQQHKLTSNTTNATIDDLSFWTRERQTSYTWVTGVPIWTISAPTVAWTAGGTVNFIPLAITGNFVVVDIVCCISDGTLSSSNTLLLPHVDVGDPTNEVSIVRNGTAITIISGGADRSAYSGYVTVYYYKT
jgi:hypothetical protein